MIATLTLFLLSEKAKQIKYDNLSGTQTIVSIKKKKNPHEEQITPQYQLPSVFISGERNTHLVLLGLQQSGLVLFTGGFEGVVPLFQKQVALLHVPEQKKKITLSNILVSRRWRPMHLDGCFHGFIHIYQTEANI